MQPAAVIAFSGFNNIFQVDLRKPRNRKKGEGKASSLRGDKRYIPALHSIKPTWEFGTRCLDPHLCYLSTARSCLRWRSRSHCIHCAACIPRLLCCYSPKNSACWIVHSSQVCGVRSYYIKKGYHRRRSRHNVVRMHGTIREDRISPVNPTWTGHRTVCNLWQGVYCSSPHKHSDVLRKLTYACNAKHQANKMMFVYTMGISSQTALSTSTRRLVANIVPALTIHPREIQTLIT